jgi:hypothetical protein
VECFPAGDCHATVSVTLTCSAGLVDVTCRSRPQLTLGSCTAVVIH